jgi:hypothetical protein
VCVTPASRADSPVLLEVSHAHDLYMKYDMYTCDETIVLDILLPEQKAEIIINKECIKTSPGVDLRKLP